MEGLVIFAVLMSGVVGLAYMARNKTGQGDASDIAAQKDIPYRPGNTGRDAPGRGPGWVGTGYEPLDDKTGDAGVRPRE